MYIVCQGESAGPPVEQGLDIFDKGKFLYGDIVALLQSSLCRLNEITKILIK